MIFAALALPILFALSAFFSGTETVLMTLTSVQRARIRARNPKADRRIARCLSNSAVLFSTLLVGNTLVNFAIATIGYALFVRYAGGRGWLAVPVMTVALLVFGEITPKRIALRHAESLAPTCARLLHFWRALLTPFNRLLQFSSRAFAPMLKRERRALSDGELVSVLETASERGEFSAADAEMIAGVLRLSEQCASDEMTPRVDVEGYDVDLPEAARAAQRAGARHSRLLVYRRSPDAVEGVMDRETGRTEDALFVPETMTLDDLLVVFGKSGKDFAVVSDEYGGTAGIITVNDVLELVCGPKVFDGERSAEPALVRKGPSVWEIDARASLDEVNRALDLELEADDADRLAGWVSFHAERIPHVGQEIVAQGCRATVLKRRKRRVVQVRLEVLKHPDVDTDAELIAETDEAVEKTEEDDA